MTEQKRSQLVELVYVTLTSWPCLGRAELVKQLPAQWCSFLTSAPCRALLGPEPLPLGDTCESEPHTPEDITNTLPAPTLCSNRAMTFPNSYLAGMAVFWYSGPALTGELGPLYLICWETNEDLDSALGERTRMWFSALALDHRSRCALWSQILSVCVGREYVVLWTGQTLSGDQLTLEFISFEKRSNSPCSSFFNCPCWRESRENHCIWMGKYVDAPYDKWKVNHRKWDSRGR